MIAGRLCRNEVACSLRTGSTLRQLWVAAATADAQDLRGQYNSKTNLKLGRSFCSSPWRYLVGLSSRE